jgi:hypothetical protein
MFGEHPRKATIQNAWFSPSGGSVKVWVAISWYSVGSNITFHCLIIASNHVHSMISEK